MKPFVIGLLAGAALLGADGKMVVNGKTVALTHVYAWRGAEKGTVFVVAVDRELSPEVRTDTSEIWQMSTNGKVNGMEFEFSEGSVGWRLRTKLAEGSYSASHSPVPFTVDTNGPRVKGRFQLKAPVTTGGTTYDFDIPVDVAMEKIYVEQPATAADRAAARTSPATQAYVVYLEALRKGDKEGILKAVAPERAAMARKSPEFPKMLAMIQGMQPKNIAVVKVKGAGEALDLMVTGTENGKPQTGIVKMERVAGAWLIMGESWKGAL